MLQQTRFFCPSFVFFSFSSSTPPRRAQSKNIPQAFLNAYETHVACAHTKTHTEAFVKCPWDVRFITWLRQGKGVCPPCVPQRTSIYSLKVTPDDLLLFKPYIDLLLVCVQCVLADKGLQEAGKFCITILRDLLCRTLC